MKNVFHRGGLVYRLSHYCQIRCLNRTFNYRFPSGHSVDLLIYLNFNPSFFFFLSNALSRIIFSIFLAYPIIKLYAKIIQLNWVFKLSYLS